MGKGWELKEDMVCYYKMKYKCKCICRRAAPEYAADLSVPILDRGRNVNRQGDRLLDHRVTIPFTSKPLLVEYSSGCMMGLGN